MFCFGQGLKHPCHVFGSSSQESVISATVGGALIWTLDQGLGPAFTPETKEAWIQAYTILADTMKAAAAEKLAAA